METPVAPGGVQNAPGVTVFTLTEGSELCVGVGVTSGAGVTVTVGELVGLGVVELVIAQVEIRELSFSDSFASTVKEYLTFMNIQFCI